MSTQFDAIVIGSGITGGWAAKELTEKGLKVLLIERGPMIEHQVDYKTETLPPWELEFRGKGDVDLYEKDYPIQRTGSVFDEWTQSHFVNDRENPYQTSEKEPYNWYRGYQLGGKSLMWGRHCYRFSDIDFGANAADGHGTDWPIRYKDVAPWYDYVENFIGVNGSKENLRQLPDGQFQPPMAMNSVEKHLKGALEAAYPERRLIIGRTANLTEPKPGREKCQYRNICARGCSFGAYFSTQSSTLPAARDTGNLTLMTDTLVERIDYDPKARRVIGVRVIDTKTRDRGTFTAKLIFLCAGTVNSVSTLLRSDSEAFPNGLANSSGVLGQYFMDHAGSKITYKVPGFDDHTYFGNRPTAVIIPRFINVDQQTPDLLRGYSYQGMAYRKGWSRGEKQAGIGQAFKASLRGPGDWFFVLGSFAETLPRAQNRVTLDPLHRDQYGLQQSRIELSYSENEHKLIAHAEKESRAMLGLIKAEMVGGGGILPGGVAIHEMGGARMGSDPKTSVLNAINQAHDIPNLFVTDGSAMSSTACQNPSLTYMALTARASDAAVSKLKAGVL